MATNSSLHTLLTAAAVATVGLLTVNEASARQLSASEAFNRAVGVSAAERGMMSINSTEAAPELVYTVETEDEPTVYVFNRQGGGAWIVAANDAVPNGLLGYTDNGEFDVENMPENVAGVLYQYGQQVAYASQQSSLVRSGKATRSMRIAVEPLVSARWGQTGIYNAYAPKVGEKRCPSGCVATAMGQIMETYRYPSCGTGSVTYRPAALTETLSYDFDANPIEWDAISLNGNGLSTDAASSDAIGRLLYACGMSVKMNYNVSGSGSSLTSAARALAGTFGYDKGIGIMDRDYFEDWQWEEMLYNEIGEGRPVLYSGRSDYDGGHAFVIDGYSLDGYYHVNWGWDGQYNGYFLITALDPRQNNKGFNYSEQMVIGIQPAQAGSSVRPVFQLQGDISLENYTVSRNNYGSLKIKSTRGIFNQSVVQTTITMGVRLTGLDGTEQYIAATSSKTMTPGQGVTYFQISQKELPASGRYLVSPVVRGEDGQWVDMLTSPNSERALYLDVDGNSLVFTPESEMISNESVKDILVTNMAVKNGSVKAGSNNFDVVAHFTNTSSNYYVKSLTPTLLDSEGNVVATGNQLTVELEALELEEAEWNCLLNNSVEEGNYRMALIDNKGKTIGTPIEITVSSDNDPNEGISLQGIDETAADAGELLYTEIYTAAGQLQGRAAAGELDLTAGLYILRHHYDNGRIATEKRIVR